MVMDGNCLDFVKGFILHVGQFERDISDWYLVGNSRAEIAWDDGNKQSSCFMNETDAIYQPF